MAARSIYRRLTGKRRKLHTFTQLFLGPDHLLLLRSNRFEERYQRFYFKDIQALVVTGLPSRAWLQASMAVLAGTIFLLALTVIPLAGWRALAAMVGVVPAVIAVADYVRGERCSMIVKTAVSNEALPPVSRMSIARLVITRLKPEVERIQQGEWTAGMTPASGPPVMTPRPRNPAPANRLLPAVFGLVTLNALIYAVARLSGRNEVLIMLVYTVFTEIVLAIATTRRRSDDPRWILFLLSGVVAVCSTVDIVGGIGILGAFVWWASEPQRLGTTPNFERFAQLPWGQGWLWWGFGWRAVIASAGWATFVLKIDATTGQELLP